MNRRVWCEEAAPHTPKVLELRIIPPPDSHSPSSRILTDPHRDQKIVIFKDHTILDKKTGLLGRPLARNFQMVHPALQLEAEAHQPQQASRLKPGTNSQESPDDMQNDSPNLSSFSTLRHKPLQSPRFFESFRSGTLSHFGTLSFPAAWRTSLKPCTGPQGRPKPPAPI